MFEALTEKLELTFKKLKGQGKISEKNIQDALREVRIALLEADVNFKVVKSFLESVSVKAMGQEVMRSLTPEQHFISIVRDELITLLGEQQYDLDLKGSPPVVVMLVGLQGSGKTTTAAKLAHYLKREKKRNPYLVPADVYRPAAIDQLKILGSNLNIPVHPSTADQSPVAICKQALQEARSRFHDTLLIDTAGRLHIAEELMQEVMAIKQAVQPHHILMVADAMTGQDAVNQAQGFNDRIEITGIILTKLDGDARGGAALSMRQVVQKPILFAGVGEKAEAFEPFYPDRLASRILGMGDVLSLIEKAQSVYEERETLKIENLAKNQFSLEDFQTHLRSLGKMGSIGEVLDLIPGGKNLSQKMDMSQAEKQLKQVDAIINSMTPEERRQPALLNGSRRRRIARGSGTSVTEVNRMIKQFLEMKKMLQRMTKLGPRGLLG
ncbi:MAG: signal recognition particle protein, partial [Candidatus Binatia bacterium]